jgi:hypothetical protein
MPVRFAYDDVLVATSLLHFGKLTLEKLSDLSIAVVSLLLRKILRRATAPPRDGSLEIEALPIVTPPSTAGREWRGDARHRSQKDHAGLSITCPI